MKFDIVRSWKDEAYRQSLSEEQLRSLPTNPVGELELTCTELQSVTGGFGPGGFGPGGFGPGGFGPGGVGAVGVSSFFGASTHEVVHSFAAECDQNFFSNVFQDSVNIASPLQVHCKNRSNNEREDEI